MWACSRPTQASSSPWTIRVGQRIASSLSCGGCSNRFRKAAPGCPRSRSPAAPSKGRRGFAPGRAGGRPGGCRPEPASGPPPKFFRPGTAWAAYEGQGSQVVWVLSSDNQRHDSAVAEPAHVRRRQPQALEQGHNVLGVLLVEVLSRGVRIRRSPGSPGQSPGSLLRIR